MLGSNDRSMTFGSWVVLCGGARAMKVDHHRSARKMRWRQYAISRRTGMVAKCRMLAFDIDGASYLDGSPVWWHDMHSTSPTGALD